MYNFKNKLFTFDKERFEKSLLNNDSKEFLETLVILTKEGLYIDCHLLNSEPILFYNKLPIIVGGIYKYINLKIQKI